MDKFSALSMIYIHVYPSPAESHTYQYIGSSDYRQSKRKLYPNSTRMNYFLLITRPIGTRQSRTTPNEEVVKSYNKSEFVLYMWRNYLFWLKKL